MKGRIQFGVILAAIGLFYGCQTGSRQTVVAGSPQASPSVKTSVRKVDINGDWLCFFHCSGNDYYLDARLDSTPETLVLHLSGYAKPMRMRPQGMSESRPVHFPPLLKGVYDDNINAFTVSDKSGLNGTHVHGVFASSQRFAAKINGRQWKSCSLVVGVRKHYSDVLKPLVAKEDSKLGKMASRTALGSLVNAVMFSARGKYGKCSADETGWARMIQEKINGIYTPVSSLSNLSVAMFSKENFEPYIGKPLVKIGLEEGCGMATRLRSTSGCGQIDTGDPTNRKVLNDVILVLQNRLPMTRNYVMVTNAAREIIWTWLSGNSARAASLERIYRERPEMGLERIVTLERKAQSMTQLIWPLTTDSGQSQISASKNRLEKKRIFNALAREIRATDTTFSGLNTLALFPSTHKHGYRLLTEFEKRKMESQIQQQINAKAVEAAVIYIGQNPGEPNYDALKQWGNRFPAMAAQFTPEIRQTIDRMIDIHQKQIVLSSLAAYKKQFNQALSQLPAPLAALSSAVAFEKKMVKFCPALLKQPEFKQFAMDRDRSRHLMLTRAIPQIRQKIAGILNKTQLQKIRSAYLLPKDEATVEGITILGAITEQLKGISPFSGYPSAKYLNALYGADFEALRQMDRAFIAPYENLMNQWGGSGMFQMIGRLTEALSGAAIKSENFVKSMQLSIENTSLIVPMFAVYLTDYQDVYGNCLSPGARTYRKTTAIQTVYESYAGFEYARTTDTVFHDYIKVNPRFVHVFEAVGLTEPDSALGRLADMMFSKNGRINVNDIVRSTRMMMNRFPCNGSIMAEMEKNMLSYFDDYLVRRNKAARSLLGQ